MNNYRDTGFYSFHGAPKNDPTASYGIMVVWHTKEPDYVIQLLFAAIIHSGNGLQPSIFARGMTQSTIGVWVKIV